MTLGRFRKIVPLCDSKNMRHNWKDSDKVYGETGICAICGYDQFDDTHRQVSR